MKFTFLWLKEHLETEASLKTIVDTLNRIGLEVSNLKEYHPDLYKLKVVEIIDIFKHANANKLSVCNVQSNTDTYQVVCGAPNLHKGMRCVFAPTGTFIPGINTKIIKTDIRGITSNGMLCSEKELEISDNHSSIISLSADTSLDASVLEILGLDDPIIEIEITPNRGDCLGVRGIARDLAATGLGTLKELRLNQFEDKFSSKISWNVDLPNQKKNLCPLIFGRTFRNVKNKTAPIWMKNRLSAIGLRPISAIVDITNYIMIDIGRPLHAYDVRKIKGSNLTVRLAKNNEQFQALNGKIYKLDQNDLVISDEDGPDDLAGIMGGERTGVDENTTEIFLESAIFSPNSVSNTGRRHNIFSDARFRFERGLDYELAEVGITYASDLINEICGGEASSIVEFKTEKNKQKIEFDISYVKKLVGLQIKSDTITNILKKLGFQLIENDRGKSTFLVPSWRNDVEQKTDLVEEIIRIYGYHNIPTEFLKKKNNITKPSLNLKKRINLNIRKSLSVLGYNEVVTFSFTDSERAKIFGGGNKNLNLLNPISSDLSDMRPSIIPNLIDAVHKNINRGIENISLFEVGPVFINDQPDGQLNVASTIRYGNRMNKDWKNNEISFDFFDIKSDLYQCLDALSFPTSNLKIYSDAPNYFHPGKSGVVKLGNVIIANLGEISPITLNKLNFKKKCFCLEIFLDNLPRPKKSNLNRPLLKKNIFQSVFRDFSFVFSKNLSADEIIGTVIKSHKDVIKKVIVFDVYQGDNIPKNKKSVAFNVELVPYNNTFTDSEIDQICNKIIDNVTIKLNGEIRSS